MAIPSRGIGWGTEENLLWEISKQLEKLTCVTAGGCGSITTTTTTTNAVAPTTYKVYSALISQQGVSDPTVLVTENTIGTMTITRNNAGVYYFVSPEFNSYDDYGKVLCFISNGSSSGAGVLGLVNGQYVPPINGIQVISLIGSTLIPSDGIIQECSIEIRLYN